MAREVAALPCQIGHKPTMGVGHTFTGSRDHLRKKSGTASSWSHDAAGLARV
jgi:hypothetical protein